MLQNPDLKPVKYSMVGVTGEKEKITQGLIGEIRLPDGKWFKQKILVTNNPMAFPGILLIGVELLNRFNYQLVSFSRPKEIHFLSLDGHRVPVFYDPEICSGYVQRKAQLLSTEMQADEEFIEQGAAAEDPPAQKVLLRVSAQYTITPYSGVFITTNAIPNYTGTLMVTDVDARVYAAATKPIVCN